MSTVGKDGNIIADATDLLPATTYCLRVIAVDENGQKGEPSPDMIVDTEAVGCSPDASDGCCCVVQ